MIQTKTKKILAILALVAISATNFSMVSAATNIGTGSITGSGASATPIIWDDAFPGFATGSVSDIKIKARVNPTLNMSISAEQIDLGILAAGVTSTGSLFLEIGTNAKSGVSITARSQSGGLTNTADSAVQINDLTTDGLAESYKYASTPNATSDSSSVGFTATGLTEVEINNNTAESVIYSTNKGEATNLEDDVEFVVSATAEQETPAGDYEDKVTFTVVWNF